MAVSPPRVLTPEEKIEKEKRDFVFACTVAGLAGLLVVFALAQLAMNIQLWKKEAARPKAPWELPPA